MRTLRIILLVLPLFYFSCTKDNPCTITPVKENPILPKQTKLIITENIQNGVNQGKSEESQTYIYDGNKIISTQKSIENKSDVLEKVTYSGDLITKIINYQNEKIIKTESYNYNDSNQLIEYIIVDMINPNSSLKEVYTHNQNGSITAILYNKEDFANQVATSIITFDSTGEVDKIVITDTNNNQYIYSYTYDDKIHMFKNVTGRAAISFTNSQVNGINHNVLSETLIYQGQELKKSNYQYNYNENNYPITMIVTANAEILNTRIIGTGQTTY